MSKVTLLEIHTDEAWTDDDILDAVKGYFTSVRITAPQEAEPNEEISMSVTDKYGDLRYVRDEKAEQPVKCIYCYANKVTAEKLASDLVVAVKECNRLKQQLSATNDERREGWQPTGAWEIDTSTGRPILVYEKCSVIEAEQAQYVLNLIAHDERREDWISVSERLPLENDGEVLVLMPDGHCEIAWASYWHGASNAFASWSFRSPDEDENPTHWRPLPQSPASGEQK